MLSVGNVEIPYGKFSSIEASYFDIFTMPLLFELVSTNVLSATSLNEIFAIKYLTTYEERMYQVIVPVKGTK